MISTQYQMQNLVLFIYCLFNNATSSLKYSIEWQDV
jgi:hypothetical protein